MIDVADSNAVYYYHFDGLGSVVALSDSDGDSCQSYEYSVYGQVAAEDPNHTNPYIGRFLQTDPVGYGNGINWYAYCRNNPLNYVDPSGLYYITGRRWILPRYWDPKRAAESRISRQLADLMVDISADHIVGLAEY